MSALPSRDPPLSRASNGGGGRQWRRVWWRRLVRVWNALGRNNISILAAGAAYYAMLSIFPAMSAVVLSYGLVADPLTIERHIDVLAGVLPAAALKLLADQLHVLVTAPSEKLGLGLIVSVVLAVWTATSATTAMMNALTVAYEGRERRGFFHFYGLAIALTGGQGLFGLVALLLIAGVPPAVAHLPVPELWRWLLPLVRWPILAALALLGLGMFYRWAPSRDDKDWDILRVGTISASLLWLAGSAAFSFYAGHFGSYDRTYGSLGAVAVMLVWLYVTAYIILIGAELNGDIGRGELRRIGANKSGAASVAPL
jgi:membrane protein